jgi:hypothetical protein
VAWWPGPDALVVRIVSFAPFSVRVGPATILVAGSSGLPLPQPPAPPVTWHQSFRYFRLSQTSDDLFDAYRNAYLALESMLDHIAPQEMRSTGRPKEREGEWFKRALTAAGALVPLSRFIPADTSDAVDYLFADLYQRRSAMSHSKERRGTLLPRDEADRQAVSDSLLRLVKLYLELIAAQLGTHRVGGGLLSIAFQHMAEPTLNRLEVFASDDETPFSPTDASVNPGGGQLIPVRALGPASTPTPFRTARLYSSSAHDLQQLPFIARIAGRDPSGQAVMAEILKGRLKPGGARLEVLFGIHGENANQPRERYAY